MKTTSLAARIERLEQLAGATPSFIVVCRRFGESQSEARERAIKENGAGPAYQSVVFIDEVDAAL